MRDDSVNVMYMKVVRVYQTFTRNIAGNHKSQVVLSHDNSIIASNGHQPPVSFVTLTQQPSVKLIYPIIT